MSADSLPEFHKDVAEKHMRSKPMNEKEFEELVDKISVVEQCPNCDNSGCYAIKDEEGDPMPQQCQFCYTVPNSVFNIKSQLLQAYRDLTAERDKYKKLNAVSKGCWKAVCKERDRLKASCAQKQRNFESWKKAAEELKEERDRLKEALNKKLKVICICGSTRFADMHAIKRWEFEKDGKAICLMINYLPGWYAEEVFGKGKHDHFGEASGRKEILDELHFRKIDMADEVFVINVDGYIGESTRNEIEYAVKTGKPVRYLE